MPPVAADVDKPAVDEYAFDDEYAVVRSPLNRGGTAILYFVVVFYCASPIYHAVDRQIRVAVSIFCVLVLCGLLLALSGLRRDTTKFPALLAVILHIGGMLCIIVPVVGFFVVLWF